MKFDDTLLSVAALALVIFVSVMLGCQYNNNKNRRKHKHMKWTCGVEGGCEKSIHGTYDTQQQCEMQCGGNNPLTTPYDETTPYQM